MKKENKKLIEIQKKLLKLIEKKKKIKYSTFKEKIKFRYLEKGHLDSINLINFIIAIEDEFLIKFSSKDTESESFRSLEGISNLILKKK